MATKNKKRKSSTTVSEPQKKSPKVSTAELTSPAPTKKKGISKKAKGPKASPSIEKPALVAQTAPATTAKKRKVKPKAEKAEKKSVTVTPANPKKKPAKTEVSDQSEQKLSKSTKMRLVRKKRMDNLKEKAEQGDPETLEKIQAVIKRIHDSHQKTKHSTRKLVKYKTLLKLYSKDVEAKVVLKKPKKASK